MGLILDEIELRAKELAWQGHLFLAQPAEAIVRVSAENLTRFVASQLPPLVQNVRLHFEDGLIVATASVKLVLEVTATAFLKPEISEGRTLNLRMVRFDGPGVARGLVEAQIEQRNPVFDTSSLPISIHLVKVLVGDFVEVHGTVSPPSPA